ncbi:hypothetical protein [Paenibacillus lutrae]|uniref:Uncharacterized protein n=1 Tax=Paenibacillus lutrae TaxID=2078573 RepID=A0A7X3K0W1_9BACL|nr:hypothetical protein [Paenibacillus lutrae]MVP01371.1 hypothetical protein [Paenibacillus lutrae]
MFNRKWLYAAGLVLLLAGSYAAVNQYPPTRMQSEEAVNQEGFLLSTSQADYKVYKDLKELESFSKVIVEAQVVSTAKVEEFTQNGHKIDAAGKVDVKVNQSFKGDLNPGDIITVYEPGYMEDGMYVNTEGYKNMTASGKYMLFLAKSPEGVYAIRGLYQGKFDLTISQPAKESDYKTTKYTLQEFDKLDYVGREVGQFNTLKKEVLSKYGSK